MWSTDHGATVERRPPVGYWRTNRKNYAIISTYHLLYPQRLCKYVSITENTLREQLDGLLHLELHLR
jgi:hypothetical protein